MKKIISSIIVVLQLFILFPSVSANSEVKKMIMVSAYYSPLPNQSFYMRGSYEGDIRLNGRGTNGADGTEVYIGMIAAPSSYSFGTMVNIPGLGVGTVHDRGGAIKSRNAYDRIDVWMGYGEAGLSRALNWGKRLVEGDVYINNSGFNETLNFNHISSTLPQSTLNRLSAKTLINPSVFVKNINKVSSKKSIKELQDALQLFGYFHGNVDGIYTDETRKAVLNFQLNEGVIFSVDDLGAGNFGPKTQQALKTKLENFNSRVTKEQNRLRENLNSLSVGLGKNSKGSDVYNVQQMLWELGYYKGNLNSVYDNATMDAVLNFQKDYGVVNSDNDLGAGYFGKKTHAALTATINNKVSKLSKYPNSMQIWVPAKIDLPKLDALNITDIHNSRHIAFDQAIQNIVKSEEANFNLQLKDKGDDVKKLQNILISYNYLGKGLNTGYLGEKTKKAIIKLQLDKKLIESENDLGAGNLGPKTQSVLKTLI